MHRLNLRKGPMILKPHRWHQQETEVLCAHVRRPKNCQISSPVFGIPAVLPKALEVYLQHTKAEKP
jgi:hypothetical protein